MFRSSTFEFANAEEGELFFKRAYGLPGDDGKSPGLVYSRLNNPNTEIFEDKMVAVERGSRYASAFPSGMAAISTTIMALVPKGGHILHTNPVYGGTYFFLKNICPDRLSITTAPIDTSNDVALSNAIRAAPRLDALFLETPANPTLTMTDISRACQLVKEQHPSCLVMVDNTFLGPVFQAPFQCSPQVDVILYSASKFIGGHSDLTAGVALTQSEDLISKINGYRTILGPTISPDVCSMLTRSLETVWLRMERQAEKAAKVVAALAAHPRVERVLFPGFYSSETSTEEREAKMRLYEKQCTGTGSMVTIILKPNTRKAAYSVLNGLDVAHLAVSLGRYVVSTVPLKSCCFMLSSIVGIISFSQIFNLVLVLPHTSIMKSTETLAQHPRSMTHSDMAESDLDATGMKEGLIRISVGLESSKDIIADLLSALDLIEDENDNN